MRPHLVFKSSPLARFFLGRILLARVRCSNKIRDTNRANTATAPSTEDRAGARTGAPCLAWTALQNPESRVVLCPDTRLLASRRRRSLLRSTGVPLARRVFECIEEAATRLGSSWGQRLQRQRSDSNAEARHRGSGDSTVERPARCRTARRQCPCATLRFPRRVSPAPPPTGGARGRILCRPAMNGWNAGCESTSAGLAAEGQDHPRPRLMRCAYLLLLFFITLGLEMSDTKVYEP